MIISLNAENVHKFGSYNSAQTKNISFSAIPANEFSKNSPIVSNLIIEEITKLMKISINIDLLYSQEASTLKPDNIQAVIAGIINKPLSSDEVAKIMDRGFAEIADDIISFNFVRDNDVHLQLKDLKGKLDAHYIYNLKTGILSQSNQILIPQNNRLTIQPINKENYLMEGLDLSKATGKWLQIKELFIEMEKGLQMINERASLTLTGGKFRGNRPHYIT